jgi:hypothetical protein
MNLAIHHERMREAIRQALRPYLHDHITPTAVSDAVSTVMTVVAALTPADEGGFMPCKEKTCHPSDQACLWPRCRSAATMPKQDAEGECECGHPFGDHADELACTVSGCPCIHFTKQEGLVAGEDGGAAAGAANAMLAALEMIVKDQGLHIESDKKARDAIASYKQVAAIAVGEQDKPSAVCAPSQATQKGDGTSPNAREAAERIVSELVDLKWCVNKRDEDAFTVARALLSPHGGPQSKEPSQ